MMCGVFFEGIGVMRSRFFYIGYHDQGLLQWTVISSLCAHVTVGFYSNATGMLQLVPLVQYT